MPVIGFWSLQGAPGVTTTVCALGATWPEEPAVIVEADPSGGVLMPRLQLAPAPGLTSLAAAARRDDGDLTQHLQRLPGGLRVCPAPPGASAARAALTALEDSHPEVLSDAPGVVLVDHGRLTPAAVDRPLARTTDLAVLLLRPELAQFACLQATAGLGQRLPRLGLVLAGDSAFPTREVQTVTGLTVHATLPRDEASAQWLAGQRRQPARAHRLPLMRAAETLAGRLHQLLQPEPTTAGGGR